MAVCHHHHCVVTTDKLTHIVTYLFSTHPIQVHHPQPTEANRITLTTLYHNMLVRYMVNLLSCSFEILQCSSTASWNIFTAFSINLLEYNQLISTQIQIQIHTYMHTHIDRHIGGGSFYEVGVGGGGG